MRRLLPRVVLGLLLLVVPAAADAPADQYDPFDRDSPEVRDAWTTLRWVRAVDRTPKIQKDADDFCRTLGAALPTVKELLTIVDEAPHQEYEGRAIVSKMIDGQGFPSTPVDKPFWTSTPAAGTSFWTVSFATGVTAQVDGNLPGAYARCVK